MSSGEAAGAAPRLVVEGLRRLHLGPVDLAVGGGECLCLSGESGAGKSLLLRALADLDPHVGRVRLGGRDMYDFAPAEWRRVVGYLQSESQWWQDRIGDHFPVGTPDGLEALGLPSGCMAWEVGRCSTGERQRLALLRLLANRPRVLLLDEPTASLDPAATTAVEALLDRYRRERGAALVWVSHDPAQIRRVGDRHLRVVAGTLREEAA